MATISRTRRYVADYAQSEPWKADHDQAMRCQAIEEAMIWGGRLFRAVSEDEARFQSLVFRGELDPDDPVQGQFEDAYRTLLPAFEAVLDAAEACAAHGFTVAGRDDFRLVVDEARCMVGSFDIETEIRPHEELLTLVRPDNPDPARYGA